MAIKKIRVVLDTNWYISATINKKSRRALYELLTDKHITILFSQEILKEYNQVIMRPKFKKLINHQQVARFINLIILRIESIEVNANLSGSRDLKDNFLLSLSHDGKAEYLITGDTDLLILKTTGSTRILTLDDFLNLTSPPVQ